MKDTDKKKPLWRRVVKGVLLSITGLICTFVLLLFLLWGNEIRTVLSIKEIRPRNASHHDGAVYYMDVKGGFYLEDMLEQGGISSDAELGDFFISKLTKGFVKHLDITSPDYGCSTFTAVSSEGDALFARNYDNKETCTCIVRTHAKGNRHASISTTDLSGLGIKYTTLIQGLEDKFLCLVVPYLTLDGVNDAGVSCCINMSYQGGGSRGNTTPTNQTTDKPDLTSCIMLRLILDYADNLEEAVAIASSYDLHDSVNTSFHYMVADASGRSAILEWVCGDDTTDNDGSARKLVITYNDADTNIGEIEGNADYQWMTNFIIQPGYYPQHAVMPGIDRYQRIYEELNKTDGVVANEEEAMQLLGQVAARTWYTGQFAYTQYSVVYNMTDKSMLWVSNENYEDETALFKFNVK